MKKLIFGILLSAMLTCPVTVFADTTVLTARNIRTAGSDQGFSSTSAIGGARSGKVWEIDNRGNGIVQQYAQTRGVASGIDTLIRTGAARLTSVTVAGTGTSAGDKVDIYDATSITGDPVFEVSLGTAEETVHININGGLQFDTGIFVDLSALDMIVTIGYDT